MTEVRTIHANGRFGKVVPVRLRPGTDVMDGLKRVCEEQGIKHGAVLGGIGNITGAMMGGLVLGLLEAFAASYLSLLTNGAFGAEYKDIFAFSILILILIFRPMGLLGTRET